MPLTTLVTYASKHGSTAEVAAAVAETLRAHGRAVELRPARDVTAVVDHDAVVLGGALYIGRLHREAAGFLRRFRRDLTVVPLAVFAMGPIKDESEGFASSRAQLDRALRRVPELTPVDVAIFGGAVDPSTLRFPFSHMPAADIRDWGAIRGWADELDRRLVRPATR